MLIGKIIKFDSEGLSPLIVHVVLQTVPCFPQTGPGRLQNLTQKCKILNEFWA